MAERGVMRNGAINTVLCWCSFLLLVALSAPAQFRPGDIIAAPGVLANGVRKLLGITPTGVAYTLNTPPIDFVGSMLPSPDNRTIWFSGYGPNLAPGTYQIDPNGTVTSISKALWLLEADGAGNILGYDPGYGIVRLRRGPVISTIYSSSTFFYLAAGIDLASGDLITDQGQYLERLTLFGTPKRIQLLSKTAALFLSKLESIPTTGYLLGSPSSHHPEVLRLQLRPFVNVTTLKSWPNLPPLADVTFNPDFQTTILPFSFAIPNIQHTLLAFDSTSATVTRTLFASPSSMNLRVDRVTVAHSRHLAATSQARTGGVYSLLVSSPAEPGASYVVAMSFGFGPGLQIADGRKIPLKLDPLFYLSLSGAPLFSRFKGLLDSHGEATASMTIPAIPQRSGVRFFSACVTILNDRISMVSAPVGATVY